jgi:hypothetical protein
MASCIKTAFLANQSIKNRQMLSCLWRSILTRNHQTLPRPKKILKRLISDPADRVIKRLGNDLAICNILIVHTNCAVLFNGLCFCLNGWNSPNQSPPWGRNVKRRTNHPLQGGTGTSLLLARGIGTSLFPRMNGNQSPLPGGTRTYLPLAVGNGTDSQMCIYMQLSHFNESLQRHLITHSVYAPGLILKSRFLSHEFLMIYVFKKAPT